MAAAAQPTAAAAEHPKTLKREVARGRTLVVDGQVKVAGNEVELFAPEAIRLMKFGFLVDPDAEVLPESTGPKFERR